MHKEEKRITALEGQVSVLRAAMIDLLRDLGQNNRANDLDKDFFDWKDWVHETDRRCDDETR